MSSPDSPPPSRPERPEYGEYASPEVQAAQRGTPPPPPAPLATTPPHASTVVPGRPPRARDRLASQLLLVVGALGLGMAISTAFGLDEFMRNAYEQYRIEAEYVAPDGIKIAQAAIVASHVILYLVALLGTGRLIRRGRTSFWLPLGAGVLAAIIFYGILMALMFNDPNIYDAVMKQAAQFR